MKIVKKLFGTFLAFSLALPVGITSFAALNSYTQPVVGNTFDNFTQNTSISAGSTSDPKTLTLNGAGTDADYIPVQGVFGKSSDDKSMKFSRKTASKATAWYGLRQKWSPSTGTLQPGNYVFLRWNWAFEDFNVDRELYSTLYYSSAQKWNEVNSFSYTGATKNDSILKINPNGTITFFGAALNAPYYFEKNKWYNFAISLRIGTSTAEAAGDASGQTVAAKTIAYLYVDGALLGSKEINCAADTEATIYRPYGVYDFNFVSNGVQYSGSTEALADNYYIDDIYGGHYKYGTTGVNFDMFGGDGSTTPGDVSLSGEGILTDGIHLSPKNADMTVAEFMAALQKGSGIQTVAYVDSTNTVVTDTSRTVQDGDQIRYTTARKLEDNTMETHYRKITDHIFYMKNGFESGAPSTTVKGVGNTVGYWSSTNKYEYAYNVGLKENNASYSVNTYGNSSLPAVTTSNIFYQIPTMPQGKCVVEMSAMRSQRTSGYGNVAIMLAGFSSGSKTVLTIAPSSISVQDNDAGWNFLVSNTDTNNKWYQVAAEIDSDAGTAKIYVNGVFTGVTRSFTPGTNILSSFGITVGTQELNLYGTSYIDDIKVYSGTYTPVDNTVTSNNEKIKPNTKRELVFDGDVTADDVIAATGTDAIYTDTDYTTAVTGSTAIASNSVAVFKNADNGIIEYYNLLGAPVIGNITWANDDSTVTASAVITNRCAQYMQKDVMLVVASYKDDELINVNAYTMTDEDENNLIVGDNNFVAEIPLQAGEQVKAFLWQTDLKPLKTMIYPAQ